MQPVIRQDPAPSRLRYRMQRLMLTPLFRRALHVGLPLTGIVLVTLVAFGTADRREAIADKVADIRQQIETRPEFMLGAMAIDGASTDVSDDIREVLSLDLPVSSFHIDLDAMKIAIRELPAVRDASLRVRSGGILQIDVTERVPVVIWRTRDGLELLDEDGIAVRAALFREDHADLPLVAGEGAERAVPQALQLLRAAGPLGTRLRGLVRVGERRWDVVLDRGQRILLPEEMPVQALERAIALDQAQDLLGRDVAVVDFRQSQRPTVRMGAPATDEWWKVREILLGTGRG
ncbi:MAG TPA: cell division protein FtsQ [Rhodobacteraceae bacterium]|jgi:cell division protein FtsQ|nr:cell division protein FtsQ [Paracoccaceae bacterium]HBV55201.1 cell division protein FtsQ [Paracoccaceae bacterium]